MAHDSVDWIARSGKKPKGKRPQFLALEENERLLSILMAVVAELCVVKERQDTVERLLEKTGSINRGDIENFIPDTDAAFERGVKTREYIARVMRGVQQHMESLAENELPLEEISKKIREM